MDEFQGSCGYPLGPLIRDTLTQQIRQAVRDAVQGVEAPEFVVERPKNPEHGDYACNVALLLAKAAKKAPIAIAQELASRLTGDPIESAVAVPPGFINLRLRPAFVAGQVDGILQAGTKFGEAHVGAGQKVQVEFVSANPNGPLTLGHGRNGVLGDVLARCLQKAGYQVEREFYINDSLTSLQMQLFALSVRAKYLQLLGVDAAFPEDGYKGEYVADIAQALREKNGDLLADGDEEEVRVRFQLLAEEEMLREQEQEIKDYRLSFDRFVSERSLHDGAVEAAIEAMKKGGHTYEKDGALWLRATDFGDDKDRPLVRSNGQPTYIASDAAYHKDKYDRGYDKMIVVLGADHHGYQARMHAVVSALGYDPAKLVIFIYQLIRLFRGGEQVKMSTRAGDIITLREVMDEVGVDVTRYFMLMRSHDSTLDFDLDLAKKQSDENPVYYVQYAHARICSILRKAADEGLSHEGFDSSKLTHLMEKALILKLLELPEEVELVVRNLAPHRLTVYAHELARQYHLFYDSCRVIDADDPERTKARLALCLATRTALRNTFDLIGISAPERM